MHFLFSLSLSITIALTILMSTFFQSSNARYHYHKYHKHSSKHHSHYHHRDDLINYISLPPPAFSPEPDDPDDYSPPTSPSVAPSPSVSYNHNAAPSSAIVPSPSPSYYRNAAPSNPVVPSSPLPSCDDSTRSSYAVPSPSPSYYHNAAPSNSTVPSTSPAPSPSCDCDTSAPSNSAAPSPSPSCDNSAPNNCSSNNSTPSNAVVPSPSPSNDNSPSNSPAPLPSPGYGYSAPGNSSSNQSPPSNSQIPPPPSSPSPSPSPSYDDSNRNNSRSNDTIPSNSGTPSPSPSCNDSAPPSNANSSNSTSGNSNSSKTTTPPIYSPAPSPSPTYYNSTPRNPGSSNSSSGNSSTGGCSSTPVVFDVRSFGAVGNGSSDDTKAFRSAWKAACAVDSAVLLVPADGVFMVTASVFSGPCKPGFVFQIDGVLMPPDGPDCWPAADSKKQWIVFYRADGMTLKGAGTIEGNGEDWWSLPCKPHRGPNGSTLPGPCDSPALIRFFMSNNVTVRGLRIENSPQFHIKFDACNGVHISNMSISSPSFSPNTDGIHIENTKSVEIYNSRISNGDDCISIGTGCADVHIENVTCGPGHGISIGSLGAHNSQACVSNITVRNAMIRNSDNGVRIKTWQGGTGSVSSITFDSIVMENVRNCITIDQYYCLTKQCTNQTSAVYISDVSYMNIKGTYDVKSPPVHFACSDVVACTNITMSEVELFPYEGEMMAEPFCWNAYGISETLTIPPMYCLQEGRPQSLQENLVTGC